MEKFRQRKQQVQRDSGKPRVTGLNLHFQKTSLTTVFGKIPRGSKSPGRKAFLGSKQRKDEGVDLGSTY